MRGFSALRICTLVGATTLALPSLAFAQPQTHVLTSPAGAADQHFGSSLDLAGDIAVTISAWSSSSPDSAGYVFDVGTGQMLRHLLLEDLPADEHVGAFVATDGVRAVVVGSSSKIVANGMARDFSWSRQGASYVDLFRQLSNLK